MKIKTDPAGIYAEYNSGVSYNQSIDLYENVKTNNEFMNGDQWADVTAPDLDKPVFNELKRAKNYYLSQLISDDIGISVDIKKGVEPEFDAIVPYVIKSEVDHVLEQSRFRLKNRIMVGNAITDGDGCMFFRFDAGARTGFDYKGAIDVEVIDNTNVMFGNPSTPDVQSQPYILVVYRRQIEEVKDEAVENKQDPNKITADDDQYLQIDGTDDNIYTTVVLKLWKDTDGLVNYTKICKNAVVKPPTKLGYYLYPVTFLNWERVKNSYHGVSPITENIPQQIYINKIYAMAMRFTQTQAFPKILYDSVKLPQGYDNKIGKAIGINGNPNEAILSAFRGADMSGDIPNLISSVTGQMREDMGIYDAALGAEKAENSSAIMMLQKAASAMLEIQKKDIYAVTEDAIRIIVDMMRVHYGKRIVIIKDLEGEARTVEFDFSILDQYVFGLNIEIGATSYWSEIMQIQTLDRMMQMGILDPVSALEATPSGALRNKDQITERLKQLRDQQIQQQIQMGVPNENM